MVNLGDKFYCSSGEELLLISTFWISNSAIFSPQTFSESDLHQLKIQNFPEKESQKLINQSKIFKLKISHFIFSKA